MMIAARLAGGNLFLPFLGGGILGGGFWEHSEQLGALGLFLRGFLGGGFFGALGAARSTRIFLRGFFGWGFFFWGVVGCVLD